jgi:hypothetical protein
MIQMAMRFIWSMARHQWAKWQGYEVLAPGGIRAFRETTCLPCPFNDMGQCSKCSCLVVSKTMLALEKCPIRLWNAVWLKRRP